ncbi:unnamed protein product [Moneuplotes crassus]|uniref:Uncharacterized protein n=1 Tax=Euplotes crassus TaxID=5936 RepID=A0AAD1Y956_EUPCR|nr:unnamed protein product [Moneuplotes crassus]
MQARIIIYRPIRIKKDLLLKSLANCRTGKELIRRRKKQKSFGNTQNSSFEYSHPTFESQISGKPCVVLENKSDHLIRMNYVRYVKTQFHEMRLDEERQQDEDSDCDIIFKYSSDGRVNPKQRTLNSKVYDFYREYKKLNQEKDSGLISIEEYQNRCKDLEEIHREEIIQEMEQSYDVDGYNKFLSNIASEKRMPKASFQTPILNIKPKTHQTKRSIPRTILRAVKNKPHDTVIPGDTKLKAYRDALQMLDKIKATVDDQVVINGSSLKDRLETHSPDYPQIDENKMETLETKPKDDSSQELTERSEKKVVYCNNKKKSNFVKIPDINKDLDDTLERPFNEEDERNDQSQISSDNIKHQNVVGSKFPSIDQPYIDNYEDSRMETLESKPYYGSINQRNEENKSKSSLNGSKFGYSTKYLNQKDCIDKTVDYRTPFQPLKPSITKRPQEEEISSTVFITTRPSDGPHSKSLGQRNSRNIPTYANDKSDTHSGGQIMGPAEKGLKGFLQTYFKGRKKGQDIFDRFIKQEKPNSSNMHLKMKNKSRKLKNHPSYNYL